MVTWCSRTLLLSLLLLLLLLLFPPKKNKFRRKSSLTAFQCRSIRLTIVLIIILIFISFPKTYGVILSLDARRKPC